MQETDYIQFIADIKRNILQNRYKAASLANREMLLLYYYTGSRLSKKIKEADWGVGIVRNISRDLQIELPGLRGFSYSNLQNMKMFYEEYFFLQDYLNQNIDNQDILFVQIPSGQIETEFILKLNAQFQNSDNQNLDGALQKNEIEKFVENIFLKIGFSHHILLIQKCKNIEQKIFYFLKIIENQWSYTILEHHLDSQLYEKQGKIINNFEKSLPSKLLSHATDAFKSEYLLDFINLDDEDDERILENEIVQHIKKFIMALGNDFAFMGNQYRLLIDDEEYFIDLLFFHRRLQSLIAFELKRGKFKAEYIGKMNLYLSALDTYVKQPFENPSIGIILCKEKNDKTIEFAFRDINKAMGVATYKTSRKLPKQFEGLLPDPEELKKLL